MNWYRKAQENIGFIEDMYEAVDNQIRGVLGEYFSSSRPPKGMVSWTVIPSALVNKIWRDYAAMGVVRNEKGLMQIQEQMLGNLARLEACNQLAGHGRGEWDIEEIVEQEGYPAIDPRNTEFYFDFLETQYGSPVSDYGLPKLWELAIKLTPSLSAEERLLILDQMLNVVHQRGDLAALFVEGGAGALTDLSAGSQSVMVRLGWYRLSQTESADTIVGFWVPGRVVSGGGEELTRLQEVRQGTWHENLAFREGLEDFLDSSERWSYGIARGTLFWWGTPNKSVRRQVHEHLAAKGHKIKQENSYTGLIQNRVMPTILPDP